ncbi:beta-galactosidase [Cohnella sp. GCM10027633]|uniref:beta-galactosidase n=1 Tax=unclassified Cohnella TaxID=2636738 RepID=UPI0036334A18
MILGVAYYPEHEVPEQWPIDYAKLAGAGVKQIRIAEFAWSVLEPSDGIYDWDWLDRSIALAAEHGLEVVLCTPTACPPIWLVEKHPDVLPVHKSGKTVGFGARQHRSYSSDNYISYSMRITRAMAERYGGHPNVVAWQLDNEFGGETKYDHGECSKKAFHRYLEERYGTIEALNAAWGTVFWSQRYERFDQIPLPAPISSDVMMWPHPSLELAFAKFSSDVMVRFARQQTDIIREYAGARPITTNAFMFRWGDSLNWADLFRTLDVVGMDIYTDRLHDVAFYSDACRSVLGKPYWMMEYGTGAAELDRDMETARSRGCSRFFLFKAKPFPWGQEQGGGQPELLTHTGEPSASYDVVRRYAERHEGEPELLASSAAPIGLYYHFESSWAYQLAVSDRKAYPDVVVDNVYKALFEAGHAVDVVFEPARITEQKLVIVPLHVLYDAALERRLTEFVHDGGKLVVTSDLFRKNEHNVFLRAVPELFRTVLGWTENNFIPDAASTRGRTGLLHAATYGSGQAWVMARESTAEEWRELLAKVVEG